MTDGLEAAEAADTLTNVQARRLVHRQGPGREEDGGIVAHAYDETAAPAAPLRAIPGRGISLPIGTRRLLEETPWPASRAAPPPRDAVAHVLLAAFGVVRREPSNAFNDHRPAASVRSRFPVHAFAVAAERAWWLDPVRMALVEMDADPGPTDGVRVLLSARWTDLPDFYGRLRGGLCAVESGIALRALASACEGLGVSAVASLAGEDAHPIIESLGLVGSQGWSCPWVVDLDLQAPTGSSADISPPAPFAPPPISDDALKDLRRADAALRATPRDAPAPLRGSSTSGRSAPRTDASSWAQVLWRRTAGRMPLRLTGYDARRRAVPEAVLRELSNWASAPAPDALVREAGRLCTITVIVQDIDGLAPGSYEVGPAGELEPNLVPEPLLLAAAERRYGYPLAPANGCGLRLASSLWLVHGSPRRVVEELGPAAWQAAQLWAGWVAHGICLAAAAHGLFARPALSFDEVSLGQLLGLEVDATLLMTVTCGSGRFLEPMLDLRT
jgi:hypothetical protein